MNKTVKKVILTVFAMAVILLCFAMTSFAADADITATVGYQANAGDANTVIHTKSSTVWVVRSDMEAYRRTKNKNSP